MSAEERAVRRKDLRQRPSPHAKIAFMIQASPWWAPHVYADRRAWLKSRMRISAACRRFFADEGFDEVETACLQASPGNETHLTAFETRYLRPEGGAQTLYLHTSPEFACKKLLAAGEQRIYVFARAFRNREAGPLHHPEFTMLEWYRAHEPYERIMADCAALARLAAEAAGEKRLRRGSAAADPFAEPEYLTLAQAFEIYAQTDLSAMLPPGEAPLFAPMAAAARRLGVRVASDDDWSDLFSRILGEIIEPHLGQERLTFLYEYPACEAALARIKPGDARVAERFELYACGVELANGFGELTDPIEQRRRFQEAMAERRRRGGDAYPLDEAFLAALAHMPPASGVALGFDRLAMLATGARRIEDVLWTPVALAELDA